MTRHRRGQENSRGQSLVEFALVIPLVLLMFMGIVDAGRAIFAYNALSNGAREGMRLAVVNQSEAAIQDKVRSASSGISADDVTTTFTPCPTPQIGCLASVTVSYPWFPITPIISNLVSPITFTTTTSMPIERVFASSP